MRSRVLLVLAIAVSFGFTCDPHDAPTSASVPPGLVYSLKRMWQGGATDDPYAGGAPFAAALLQGIDTGAPSGSHLSWYMVSTDTFSYDYRKLPPGLVFGLKHSRDPGTLAVKVRGVDPVDPDDTPPAGLRRMHGGDLGLSAGSGYYWFESTGEDFAGWSDDTDRRLALDALPRRFVIGLMHSVNTPGHSTTWPVWDSSKSAFDLHTFSAAEDLGSAPASHFPPNDLHKQHGGDYGASWGHGYFWYLYESRWTPYACKDGYVGKPCDDKNWTTRQDVLVDIDGGQGDDCECRGSVRPSFLLQEQVGDGTNCPPWNCVSASGVSADCIRRCELAAIQNASAFPIRIVICGDSNESGDATCCLNKPSLIEDLAPGETLSAFDFLKCKGRDEKVFISVCPVQRGAKVVLRVFTKACWESS